MAEDVTVESVPASRAADIVVGGRVVALQTSQDFQAGDDRRITSFITNVGNWELPAAEAEAFGSPVIHLEWFHETGELVAFGQVPHLGHGDLEVSRVQAGIDTVGSLFGSAGGRIVHGVDGSVREFFPAMVVGPETLVAVLAVIEHGPRMHELLWGWHLEHRKADGYGWLMERLASV